MFKKMSVGMKIVGGFALTIIIVAIVGFIGYNGLNTVEDIVIKADDANRIVKDILETRRAEKNFIIRGDTKYVDQANEIADRLIEQSNTTKANLDDASDRQLMDKIVASTTKYKDAFKKYHEITELQSQFDAEMTSAAQKLEEKSNTMRQEQKTQLAELMLSGATGSVLQDKIDKADDANRIIKFMLEARRAEKNYMLRGDEKYISAIDDIYNNVIKQAEDTKSRFQQAANIALMNEIIVEADNYKKGIDSYVSANHQLIEEENIMTEVAREVDALATEMRAIQKTKMESAMASAISLIIIIAIIGVIIGTCLAYFITAGITKPLNRSIESLSEGSEQVGSASGQVSSASQSLAEGASEQASSLEETSSSLEEMTSMTKQNADNASQAANLSKTARDSADKGNEAMERMSGAIDKIKTSSDETAKILKTIDEIAFQTNLLALNAAVEAARAGEAGRGFAVVAEEVRNLAQRSAEASRTTTNMIDESVKNSENGVEISREVAKSLADITDATKKVNDLVSEIAAASNEQAQGIGQINTAVTQMDQVTQQNASNAEESASASEELSAQAEGMKDIVGDIIQVVRGAKDGNGKARISTIKRTTNGQTKKIEKHHLDFSKTQKSNGENGGKDAKKKVEHVAQSKDALIPLDEDDFKEF